MNEFLENLKRQAQENPMVALGVGGACVTILTQFLRTIVEARNARVWAKEVSRRTMRDRQR